MKQWSLRMRWYSLSLGVLLLLGQGVSNAQTFSLASMQGTYSAMLLGYGGPLPVAAVATFTVDGKGTIAGGHAIWNVPQGFAQRTRLELPIPSGAYSVHADGKGDVSTPSLGIAVWDMIIVQVERQADGTALAQELFLMSRTIDPFAANVVTGTFHRLPDGATFTPASMAGVYSRYFRSHGGAAPIQGLGVVSLESSGVFHGLGPLVANVPGTALGERTIATIDTDGTFAINADGTGSLINNALGNVLFIITGAVRQLDGSFLATNGIVIFDDLFPFAGALITGDITRQFIVNAAP